MHTDLQHKLVHSSWSRSTQDARHPQGSVQQAVTRLHTHANKSNQDCLCKHAAGYLPSAGPYTTGLLDRC